ncbi:MAG: tRNA (adenosine(37)-N6)-threonylcarbamoyltransferase complex dimerization subunit type 1 TsaB [Candidatus Omnitrophica bacterium]|nr:tRNA (adenosine(37)-N6)-threonylcarbamoyltransferase complex dimerization subunit type 1 TsaB [Candidatus Omnitrophota bacterium]
MKILGLETSTRACSVAVSDGAVLLAEMTVAGRDRPSDQLMAAVQQVLAAAGLALADLDGIAVSAGPGSFTGIRVGVTAAKTLAYTLGKPVTAVSSLDVLAANVPAPRWPVAAASGSCCTTPSRSLWVLVDARKDKVYAARYESFSDGWPTRVGEEQLVALEQLMPQLTGEFALLGDGLVRYGAAIQQATGDRGHPLPPALWVPRASAVCRLAAWHPTPAPDVHALAPHYLYSKESDISGW